MIFLADIFNITQYIPLTKEYDWLSFFGSLYASAITIFGVFLTLKFQRKSEDEKRIEENKPEIIIDILKEEIKKENEIQLASKSDNRIYPPNYKNRIYLKMLEKKQQRKLNVSQR